MKPHGSHQLGQPQHRRRASSRQRGAGAILSMMYLVIFASLASAMAIVAQGNLNTADSFLKVNQTLAATETGLKFVEFQLNQACRTTTTRSGQITATNAATLWTTVAATMRTNMAGATHNISEPRVVGTQLRIGPISLGAGSPTFTATLTPHPIAGENYNSAYYQRPPYSTMAPGIGRAHV